MIISTCEKSHKYISIHLYFTYFRENDITNVLDNCFCVEMHSFGQIQTHELKPGGNELQVTEENKVLQMATKYNLI